ncbi:MAG: hypothetical protein CMP67_01695 [Flavobacteriales bacterium]|nr:hypothetical protein [Flavobacteriales bacterium]MBO72814.1 hypothetical protein [Flavobacteriales bacterium]|tara:strand:- start:2243 stop:2839 length:597 start_codon:yes stop_codon:yes gene_type:complete
MKKLKIFLAPFYLFILLSCSNQSSNSTNKTFNGQLTLTPAESALLSFDRMVELTVSKEEKTALKKKLKELDLYNRNNTLALFIESSKVNEVKKFIRDNYDKLLLQKNNVFVWESRDIESLLFVKDEYKSIEIGSLVQSVTQTDSTTKIQFLPESKRILSGFAMKHLNRPILLEINGKLITTVKSFGKMENRTLSIKRH